MKKEHELRLVRPESGAADHDELQVLEADICRPELMVEVEACVTEGTA